MGVNFLTKQKNNKCAGKDDAVMRTINKEVFQSYFGYVTIFKEEPLSI